jgi:anti-anti-sigma regulatory factor
MLRITPLDTNPRQCELRVEGRLVGEASLQILRQEIARVAPLGRPLVLELSGVSFVDQRALGVLADAARRGVELVGGSAWLRALLEGIET